ncbi:MAG: hypothetical protein KAT77_05860 [Nanoarchaeota archaeon]|nr:hypothetical protein [Nanoarchaeota archaeon]
MITQIKTRLGNLVRSTARHYEHLRVLQQTSFLARNQDIFNRAFDLHEDFGAGVITEEQFCDGLKALKVSPKYLTQDVINKAYDKMVYGNDAFSHIK